MMVVDRKKRVCEGEREGRWWLMTPWLEPKYYLEVTHPLNRHVSFHFYAIDMSSHKQERKHKRSKHERRTF